MSKPFHAASIRHDFPIFTENPELCYLDNAATSQKPAAVLSVISDFNQKENASVHRGLYELSSKATTRYEAVREKVARLIGSPDSSSISFTKGTTESINIVANSFKRRLQPGDNIVLSGMEHHANLIPWQIACREKGATLRVIPVTTKGELLTEQLDFLIDKKSRLVAITHVSNVLGTINPIEEIIAKAHQHQVPVLVDAAQSAGHLSIDVKKWGVDFLVFSAHKMYGPFGTGILYTTKEWAPTLTPLLYGGGSIRHVDFDQTEFLDYPSNLEAGTPNVPGVIGLGAAIDYIQGLDIVSTEKHVQSLAALFREKAKATGIIRLMGNPGHHTGIVAFNVNNVHPHDVASFLGSQGIAVRAGHHCTEPLHRALLEPATVRVSFSIYNTLEEVDRVIHSLQEVKRFWA